MTCERCGNLIPDGRMYCPACGAAVRATTPKEPVAPYPMKWYKFLIYFWLFFSAFLNLISAFSYFNGTVQGEYADRVYKAYPAIKAVDVLSGVLTLGFSAWAILTRIALGNYKRQGPIMICLFYIGSAGFNVMYYTLASLITGSNLFNTSVIVNVAVSLVIAYLNYVYFNKRKSMFVK